MPVRNAVFALFLVPGTCHWYAYSSIELASSRILVFRKYERMSVRRLPSCWRLGYWSLATYVGSNRGTSYSIHTNLLWVERSRVVIDLRVANGRQFCITIDAGLQVQQLRAERGMHLSFRRCDSRLAIYQVMIYFVVDTVSRSTAVSGGRVSYIIQSNRVVLRCPSVCRVPQSLNATDTLLPSLVL